MKAVHEGKVHFVIEMPPQAEQILKRKGTVRIKLQYDQSNEDSMVNENACGTLLMNTEKRCCMIGLKKKKLRNNTFDRSMLLK